MTKGINRGQNLYSVCPKIFIFIFLLIASSIILAECVLGEVSFLSPTPSDGSTIESEFIEINASIIEEQLQEVKFNWDSTNHTFFDDSVIFYSNLDQNAQDISQYSNTGSIINVKQCSDGRFGGCYEFDGVNDYIRFGDQSELELGTSDMSVSFWVKFTETQPDYWKEYHLGSVVGKGFLGNRVGYGGYVVNRKIAFQVRGLPTIAKSATSNTELNDGQWHHAVAVIDRDDKLSLYIDGILQDDQEDISMWQGQNILNSEDFTIGTRDAGGYLYDYKGKADEIKIYRKVLTQEEITQLYESNLIA